jgi:hypothetical protein
VTGVIVAGVGVVGFGIGGVLALGAKSRYKDASSHCDANLCDQGGLDIRDDARSKGNVATIVGGIGLAAVGAGAALFLLAPSGSDASKTGRRSLPSVGIGPGWMVVGGRW